MELCRLAGTTLAQRAGVVVTGGAKCAPGGVRNRSGVYWRELAALALLLLSAGPLLCALTLCLLEGSGDVGAGGSG